ncbi:MAG: Slp family lipoprotein [Thermodesulfovibrionales bacterium]
MKRLLIMAALVLAAAGCAHVISRDIREAAVQGVSFTEARENLGRYEGKIFVWGGFVANTSAAGRRTVVEVVQNPLDAYGRVLDKDISEGRFLAEYPGHLDPMIFKEGRLVTVAGRLAGGRKQKLGDREYLYPVLEIMEIHLWKEEKPYYYAPYPYYYDPFYDPLFYDPLFYRYPYRRYYPWWR